MSKKVLVTGAEGFIGSHLVEHLLEKGFKVRAFVLYNSFNSYGWLDTLPKEKLKQIEIFSGDVRDPNGVRLAMEGIDVVYHLAALIAIPYSYHSPDNYVDVNIKGTLNILQAAKLLKTERVLVTSTSEVYGTAQYVPIDEKHPFQGQSPYSATKIGADRMAESFYRSFNMPVTIVRPFNTYGPRMAKNDGRVVSNFIVQALQGKDITVYGSGEQTRSFCYVDDLINGMIAYMSLESDSGIPGPINLGNPGEFTMNELAEKVIQLTGTSSQLLQQPLPQDDPKQRRPDITRAKRILNWEPSVPLEEGLKKTIEYFRSVL